MRRIILILITVVLLGMTPGTLSAQKTILPITYGSDAPAREGDYDYRQIIYFCVPESTQGQLYLRIFDPDCGGAIDQRIGTFDTTTQFRLYGGTGIYTSYIGDTNKSPKSPGKDMGGLVKSIEAGELLTEKSFTVDTFSDSRWYSFPSFDAQQGEAVDGKRYFVLLVQGLGGNDGNIFDIFVSTSDKRNKKPEGLEIFSPALTVNIPEKGIFAELRFYTPRGTQEITVHNFDAAGGSIDVRTAFRSGLKVDASAQGDWAERTVSLRENETGRLNAVTFSGGTEIPNDASFFITGKNGKILPIHYPVHRWERDNNRPLPNARPLVLQDCLTVVFDGGRSTDKDLDNLHYSWNFGDGQTGDGVRVTHTYKNGGAYRVRLTVSDDSGQISNSAIKDISVKINQPPAAEAGANVTGAPGEELTFDASQSNDADGRLVKYAWNFGDGQTGDGVRVTHSYKKPGIYRVRLQVDDNSDTPCRSAFDRLDVFINAAPKIEIGKDRIGSPRETIFLDGGNGYDSDGEISEYIWDLGDGNTKTGEKISHAYEKPGTYNVVLTVRDDSGARNNSAVDRLKVTINDRPIAKAGDYKKVAVGQTVRFDGAQSYDTDGSIEYYHWDLGDGTRKQGRIISHSYAEPGSYTVQLTVRDDSRTTSAESKDSLKIDVNFPPEAVAGEDIVVTSSSVTLDGSKSSDQDDGIAAYAWDFGDGGKSAEASPTHTYTEPGTYNVKLTVTDRSKTSNNKDTDQLVVTVNQKPKADAGRDRIAAPGQELEFDASGSTDPDGTVTGYTWNFGDGTGAEGKKTTHVYPTPGVYTAVLKVTDNTGHAEAVSFDEARITVNAQPLAVAGDTISAAPRQSVTVDGNGSYDTDGNILSYRWEFSDGITGNTSRITRKFENPGIYTARLTVTDNSGAANSTHRDKMYIKINHQPRSVAGNDVFTCDTTIHFDGSQSADADGDYLQYTWDFADGTPPVNGRQVLHTFSKGGTYPVLLTVDDGTGLSNARHTSSIKVTINNPPTSNPGAAQTVCAGKNVIFDAGNSRDADGGLLKYHWDFGDGTEGEGLNPIKIYSKQGVYRVVLTVKDDTGLPCGISRSLQTVRVIDSPIAEAGEDMEACVGGVVTFDGTKSYDADGVVNQYDWDFGDGTTGGGASPTHIYSAPGTYRVILTITGDQNGQCENTDTDEVVVNVVQAPVAVMKVRTVVPVAQPVTFDGGKSTSTDAKIVSWGWDFGDGTTASGKTVSHTYEKYGRFPVTLTVQTDTRTKCGSTSIKQFITVNSPPRADAGEDIHVGVNQPVHLKGSLSEDLDGTITVYNWKFGDGKTADGLDVRHKYSKSGVYDVTLTVTDDTKIENNSHEDKIKVRVNAAPLPVIDAPERAGAEKDVTFDAGKSTDADGDPLTYTWDFGDGNTADTPQAVHRYAQPGTYWVTLFADDGHGLSNSRIKHTQELTINHPPVPRPGNRRVACTGVPVSFDSTASTDADGKIIRREWNFGDGSTADDAKVQHTFSKTGTYTVTLTVTDDSGTDTASSSKTVTVEVKNPPTAIIEAKDETYCGGVHDGIRFDGTGSRSGSGRPLTYRWNFGDGNSAVGPVVFHAFEKPGKYMVRLTVNDHSASACPTAETTMTVTVKRRK
jgi:large repetitive protein